MRYGRLFFAAARQDGIGQLIYIFFFDREILGKQFARLTDRVYEGARRLPIADATRDYSGKDIQFCLCYFLVDSLIGKNPDLPLQ